ncbi:hypothetical protein FQA39_LY13932 [Lamprigera yunnana]|nr:hypothetical protein FQA39_LY13932 [Lamprigera yunnana]
MASYNIRDVAGRNWYPKTLDREEWRRRGLECPHKSLLEPLSRQVLRHVGNKWVSFNMKAAWVRSPGLRKFLRNVRKLELNELVCLVLYSVQFAEDEAALNELLSIGNISSNRMLYGNDDENAKKIKLFLTLAELNYDFESKVKEFQCSSIRAMSSRPSTVASDEDVTSLNALSDADMKSTPSVPYVFCISPGDRVAKWNLTYSEESTTSLNAFLLRVDSLFTAIHSQLFLSAPELITENSQSVRALDAYVIKGLPKLHFKVPWNGLKCFSFDAYGLAFGCWFLFSVLRGSAVRFGIQVQTLWIVNVTTMYLTLVDVIVMPEHNGSATSARF